MHNAQVRSVDADPGLGPGAWGLCAGALVADLSGQDSAGNAGKRWALLVGVDDYTRARKLHYCGADMRALAERLTGAGFQKDNVYLLHDRAPETKYRPMKRNIEDHLRVILGLVERDDLVIVGFSGHGVHFDGKSYLCPSEAKLDDPGTLIALDDVYERLRKCRASLKIFLVDACRNDPRLGERSMGPTEATRRFASTFERPPHGILTLTSCAPGEIAREEEEFGHGVFMYYVLEGLGGRADVNRNGWVSMMEMYLYANDKTKTYVAKKFVDSQRPSLKGDIDDDFDLLRVRNPLEPTTTNSIGMKLVLIPAGEFIMGSPPPPDDEEARDDGELPPLDLLWVTGPHDNERPQHRVRITRPFYLGAYEVTQEEYQRVMGTNPSYFSASGDGKEKVAGMDTRRFPVETVSWEEATEFCRRLSRQEGKTYRLPTEAEWEYACRAGSTTKWYYGDSESELGEYAWYPGNFGEKTHPVGQKKPNAWGLYDMHGNVWEWCADRYGKDYYAKSPAADPTGPDSGTTSVHRGGMFMFCENPPHHQFRCASRGFNVWKDRYHRYGGFRVARTLTP